MENHVLGTFDTLICSFDCHALLTIMIPSLSITNQAEQCEHIREKSYFATFLIVFVIRQSIRQECSLVTVCYMFISEQVTKGPETYVREHTLI